MKAAVNSIGHIRRPGNRTWGLPRRMHPGQKPSGMGERHCGCDRPSSQGNGILRQLGRTLGELPCRNLCAGHKVAEWPEAEARHAPDEMEVWNGRLAPCIQH